MTPVEIYGGIKITEIRLWKTHMNHLAGQSESEIRMETMISPSRGCNLRFYGSRNVRERGEVDGGMSG